jgi:hypothetical protein
MDAPRDSESADLIRRLAAWDVAYVRLLTSIADGQLIGPLSETTQESKTVRSHTPTHIAEAHWRCHKAPTLAHTWHVVITCHIASAHWQWRSGFGITPGPPPGRGNGLGTWEPAAADTVSLPSLSPPRSLSAHSMPIGVRTAGRGSVLSLLLMKVPEGLKAVLQYRL